MTPHKPDHAHHEEKRGCAQTLSRSWTAVLNAWRLTGLAAGADIVFFFLFSWLATWTLMRIAGPLNSIFNLAGENLSVLAQNLTNEQAGAAIMEHYEIFMAAYQSILKTTGVFFLGTFILWVVFQSASWYLAYAIASGKKRFSEALPSIEEATTHLKRFTTISLTGFMALLAILYLSMRFSIWINISRLGDGVQTAASILIAILLLLILYSMTSGFACTPKASLPHAYTAWFVHAKTLVLPYALAVLSAYAGGYLLYLLMKSSLLVSILFALLVYAPLFSYMRVALIKALHHQPEHQKGTA